jgi:hypothetical protein
MAISWFINPHGYHSFYVPYTKCLSKIHHLPSGKLTNLWKITIFNGKIHYNSPFSIAMLNYQIIWHLRGPAQGVYSVPVATAGASVAPSFSVIQHGWEISVFNGWFSWQNQGNILYTQNPLYHLVMTNIAMENPQNKWRFIAGKIIYFYGPWLPWLC